MAFTEGWKQQHETGTPEGQKVENFSEQQAAEASKTVKASLNQLVDTLIQKRAQAVDQNPALTTTEKAEKKTETAKEVRQTIMDAIKAINLGRDAAREEVRASEIAEIKDLMAISSLDPVIRGVRELQKGMLEAQQMAQLPTLKLTEGTPQDLRNLQAFFQANKEEINNLYSANA